MSSHADKQFERAANLLRISVDADFVLAMTIGADGRVHFTVQGDEAMIETVPNLLIDMASSINEDLRRKELKAIRAARAN